MRSFMIALCLLLCSAASCAQNLTLTHARVYTAPEAPALSDATIVIRDGKIQSIAPSSLKSAQAGPEAIDCTGLTVTAGFWNSHVHILPPPLLHAETKSAAQLNPELEAMFTRWGFTSVFDIASILANTNVIRARIALGELTGPRILTTGEPVIGPNGTPVYIQQFLVDNHISIPETKTPAEARSLVQQHARDHADGIKIFAGSIEENGVLLLPADIAHAAVREAHAHHLPVFSHPSSIRGVELSLDAGVDVLAHPSTFEGLWTPVLVQRIIAAHVALVPTLTLFDVEMQKMHASDEDRQRLIKLGLSQVRAFNTAGGTILFGTDIGYIPQYDTSEEFTLMQRAGMTFPQILASLTTAPAARFGQATHSGRVSRGFDADLTVLQGDPAADPTVLSHVAYTIRAGRILFRAR